MTRIKDSRERRQQRLLQLQAAANMNYLLKNNEMPNQVGPPSSLYLLPGSPEPLIYFSWNTGSFAEGFLATCRVSEKAWMLLDLRCGV